MFDLTVEQAFAYRVNDEQTFEMGGQVGTSWRAG